jgi:hypothetical protein
MASLDGSANRDVDDDTGRIVVGKHRTVVRRHDTIQAETVYILIPFTLHEKYQQYGALPRVGSFFIYGAGEEKC